MNSLTMEGNSTSQNVTSRKRRHLSPDELEAYAKKRLNISREPWSSKAKEEIEYLILDYGQKLYLESLEVTIQSMAEQISHEYVKEGARRLLSIKRRGWKNKLYGQIGGVLLGIGLSTLVSCLLKSSPITSLEIIIFTPALLAGLAFLMFDALT